MQETEQRGGADALEGLSEPVRRLTRDMRNAAARLTPDEARYLVDAYYQMQGDRIRAGNQVRALSQVGEPNEVVGWLAANTEVLERNIKSALGAYSQGHPVGRWAESVVGIGPVISAGLLAHIDISKAPTVGHVWRFAGLDSSVTWPSEEEARKWVDQELATQRADWAEPGEPESAALSRVAHAACVRYGRSPESLVRIATTDLKTGEVHALTARRLSAALARRPWNADLKRLCWLIGESFVKVHNNHRDTYGRVYAARKVQEEMRNAEGRFSGQAERSLSTKRWARETATRAAYEAGRLPQARLHLRAQRYAVKLFLSAWHEAAYFVRYATLPPKPYVIEHLGHADFVRAPNMDVVPGWAEARAAAGL